MTIAPPSGRAELFSRVQFVMVQPSHPGNVGAAARAIKTMGFQHLSLVAPRFPDVLDLPEAEALASGAADVLAAIRIVPTLADALADSTLTFALTARARVLGPPACDIRMAAGIGCEHLQAHAGARVAIVLGTERSGLTNDDIGLCNRICHIPANPHYSSLNVAQALQLAAWELRYVLATAQSLPLLPDTHGQAQAGDEPAALEKVQAFISHWEHALVTIGFLDPRHPKKLMPRMQHLFNRNALTNDEVDMLRGVCTAIMKTGKKHQPPT